jgi:hypothetical protein
VALTFNSREKDGCVLGRQKGKRINGVCFRRSRYPESLNSNCESLNLPNFACASSVLSVMSNQQVQVVPEI